MSVKERLDLLDTINQLLLELEDEATIAQEVEDELNGTN